MNIDDRLKFLEGYLGIALKNNENDIFKNIIEEIYTILMEHPNKIQDVKSICKKHKCIAKLSNNRNIYVSHNNILYPNFKSA